MWGLKIRSEMCLLHLLTKKEPQRVKRQGIDWSLLPSVTCSWQTGRAGVSTAEARLFCFIFIFSILQKRSAWKTRLEGCQLRPDPFKFVICKTWKDSHCFFNVSTDFCSNSSLAAISFFTLASSSSAPLRRAKGEKNGIKLLTCWLKVHLVSCSDWTSIILTGPGLCILITLLNLNFAQLTWRPISSRTSGQTPHRGSSSSGRPSSVPEARWNRWRPTRYLPLPLAAHSPHKV